MARRGRPPKGKSIADLDSTARSEIDEAIRSHADESAVSIYRRLGLAQRGVLVNSFRRCVAGVRRRAAGERLSADAPLGAVTWEDIERRAMRGMLERLQAGDAKMYELALVVGRRHERARIDIERRAEERAAEKFGVEMERIRRGKIDADERLDRLAVEKGVPADVVDRIKDLYGIAI